MNDNLPNLYTAFDLDRTSDSEALGLVLSARDLRLEQMGITQSDSRRTQTVMAFSVLADPVKRATYDEKLDAGIPLNWGQIQHLGNFGTLPSATESTSFGEGAQPFHQAQQSWNPEPMPQQQPINDFGYTYGQPTTQFSGGYNPVNDQVNASMYGQSQFAQTPATFGNNSLSIERPPASTRLWMALLDGIFAGIAAGIVAGIFAGSDFLFWLVGAVVMIAYVVGFESITGSTPAKKIFGYEVRDVETHSRLSAGAAFKRNWWKFVGVVPGIGNLVTLIMAAVYGSSINQGNHMRGAHDKLANAEVVKKR